MTKIKKTLIIITAGLFFLGSVFLYLRSGSDDHEEDTELTERAYRNEDFGYGMNYPSGWDIREKRSLSYFHSALEENDLLATTIDLSTYEEVFGIDLVGSSPLTYIDGSVDYNIEQSVYLNKNDFSAKQWYNIAALAEAHSIRKISGAELIAMSNEVVQRGSISDQKEKVFDPWISRGDLIRIQGKEVLKTTQIGDHRYAGYQHYITPVDDYIFVFRFGYGGAITPREMWQRSDRHVREMIGSLKVF